MSEERQGENQALIAFLEEQNRKATIVQVRHDGLEVQAALKHDGSVRSLAELVAPERMVPRRRTGVARFQTQASFEAHAKRFGSEHSTLWADADPDSPSLTSVLNYHPKDGAAFGDHRGVYEFPLSDQWQAWVTKNTEWMNQSAFSDFILEHLYDIVSVSSEYVDDGDLEIVNQAELIMGDAAKLLQLSRGLKVNVQREVSDVQNNMSGETEMQFTEEHRARDGSKLKLPQAFFVNLPVFRGGENYTLLMLLRYRVTDGGRVVWRTEARDPQSVLQTAVESVAGQAETNTGIPLFFGTPE